MKTIITLIVGSFLLFGCSTSKNLKKIESADVKQKLEISESKNLNEEVPKENELIKQVKIETEETLFFTLDRIYFEYDSAVLTSEAKKILAENAKKLEENPELKIVIEGHCDERGTSEYNLALGEKRAESVRKYLVTYGISSNRISTISYGKEKPLVNGFGEEVWSKNRRAEFVPKN
jgi:peptidoglycan-associated lipoprotein